MMLKNGSSHYGLISVVIHWLMALAVFALFALGFWMVDLSYYSQWYRTAPYWHKSVGILLAIVLLVRISWRFISPPPKAIATHKPWETKLAGLAHLLLYLGLVILVISGYLISTEDGRAITVFDWFDVPAAGALFANQADIAGLVHEYTAYGLITMAVLHGLAAIKHHLIDKDHTLKRMFGFKL
ncbi:cytochrome b [Rheinheimera sp. MMS21-TC3]|uniref:cytochrome b n=1 Tax=Rheinheimera sp. MMS21-TC3 TaxID=3072790 RepID=UPI0028C5040E|nr:cytochrome b [Rheinheimera sp. MMS21-TC3]WNO62285.1 cytochrome b [Rheinheimera sp. MMS21-TC3]